MYAITSIESFIKSRAEIEVNDGTIIIKPKLRQELTESAILWKYMMRCY